MNKLELIKLAQRHINNYPELKNWQSRLVFSSYYKTGHNCYKQLSSDFLGYCDFNNKVIAFNHTIKNDYDFIQVLVHELAHALLPINESHSNKWLKLAQNLGWNSDDKYIKF